MGTVAYHDRPEGLGPPLGLYSHVATGGPGTLIAVAGQVGVDARGELTGDGSVAAQTEQAFANLGVALASAGAGYGDIVKSTTFLVGRSSVEPFMAARGKVFSSHFPEGRFPPNTLLIVAGLVEERFQVEIEAFALLPEGAP
jgi:enamine deaminase RidA (YjgF/YER057c/UK114 family)